MIDRFGDYPGEVDHLFTISKIKIAAKESGIESIKKDKGDINVLFRETNMENFKVEQLVAHYKPFERKIGFGMDGSKFKIIIYANKMTANDWLPILQSVIEGVQAMMKKEVKTVS